MVDLIVLEIQSKLQSVKGRIDLDGSLISTIEERKANNEENVNNVKKQKRLEIKWLKWKKAKKSHHVNNWSH